MAKIMAVQSQRLSRSRACEWRRSRLETRNRNRCHAQSGSCSGEIHVCVSSNTDGVRGRSTIAPEQSVIPNLTNKVMHNTY